MQEIRGPGHPVPDSIPEELVAVYGDQARHTVRYRRSWRYRQARRVEGWIQGRTPRFLILAALLWTVILAGLTASMVLAALRWPAQMLDAGMLVGAAATSSILTAFVIRRRTPAAR
ncbi:MAG: hypothetical protein ABR600_12965 [Actinomycetota bacterium]